MNTVVEGKGQRSEMIDGVFVGSAELSSLLNAFKATQPICSDFAYALREAFETMGYSVTAEDSQTIPGSVQ